jgi:hypothetical protein
MDSAPQPADTSFSVVIDYETIKDLAFFQEQYDRLTHEIQQVRIQLDNSPPLEQGAPRAQEREEWRAWLQLQIKSKQHSRVDLVEAIRKKGIQVERLPE